MITQLYLKIKIKTPQNVGFLKRINSINENRIRRPIPVAFEQDMEHLQILEHE